MSEKIIEIEVDNCKCEVVIIDSTHFKYRYIFDNENLNWSIAQHIRQASDKIYNALFDLHLIIDNRYFKID